MLANYAIIGVDKSEVRMFIWTISDIAAVIIFMFFVVVAICGYVSSSLEVSKPEREAAARKEEERKQREEEARKAYYEARRAESIRRNKAWAKRHPRLSGALDLVCEHPLASAILIVAITTASMIGVAVVVAMAR